jgi:hypothetical protein
MKPSALIRTTEEVIGHRKRDKKSGCVLGLGIRLNKGEKLK